MIGNLLPHTVSMIIPAKVPDAYGNMASVYTTPPAAATTRKAWLQQDTSEETITDGRDPLSRKWTMVIVAPGLMVRGDERVVWLDPSGDSVVFEVFGPGEPTFTPRGYHHHEVQLRRVDG